MKKKIEQLLSGKFEYEQPKLLFSQEKIAVILKAGDTYRGDLYVGTDDNRKIRGYVTSSNRRLVPGSDEISGTTVCLPYGVDGVGMKPGEKHEGWLCFSTNIGEYRLPFVIETEKEQIKSSAGEVKDIDAVCEIAKQDFREAYRIFTDKSFQVLLNGADQKEMAMYRGLSKQPVTYQHLEEFFIGTGKKDGVKISLKMPGAEFWKIQESVRESFLVKRSGWGHLRLDIEAKGEFLEVTKKVVTEEDFIGSQYQADYVIHKEKLGKGKQYGEILVKSPYQELSYQIMASLDSPAPVNVDSQEKQQRLSLMKDWLAYSSGKMDFKTWVGSSHFILNQLQENGCEYPEYQLYEAYLYYLEEQEETAREILLKFSDTSFSKENLELAGAYLYLCMAAGLYKDKEQGLRRLQNFYMQKEDSFLLFRILLKVDSTITTSASKAVFMMEEQFERGCRSPFLYLEAWKYISADMSLLHRLNRFWAQVFLFAGREGILTEELVMRFAYLSGYEKSFNRSLYNAMLLGYEAFPTDDTLEAICRYIMLGNPRKPEYFRLFSLAVEHGLRLTRLYEYYVETMDTSYQRALPKPLLMYFTYNSDTLGDTKKAFIYASIISNKDHEMQTYEDYREVMANFAERKLGEGHMNENYAILYQEFMGNPQTLSQAEAIAKKMFTFRLYSDDKKVRYVIVRHSQMQKEECFPCIQGVAYPRIYTEDAAILFQDDKQRRYCATVDYNLKKLFDERSMVEKVLALGAAEPGVVLHYCENTPLSRENLEIFQQLVSLDGFSGEYKKEIRKKILDYYAAHMYGEDLDDHLKKMDYREYVSVDRTKLLEVLISRGFFRQAMGIVEEFGYEGLDTGNLLKLTSRMLVKCDMAADDDLLALASAVYRNGKYDEVILYYLMKYRVGPVDELFAIWRSAKGFEMDTYELEEKILSLLMLLSDYRKDGEKVLESYVKQAGKERIIGAYLTLVSYGVFVKDYPMSSFVKERLEYAYDNKWPVNKICRLALFKALSREKNPDRKHLEMEREFLENCMRQDMVFSFFKRLPAKLLSPYQLDDKTFVEYHGNPEAKVTLYYALDAGLGGEWEYKTEPMRGMYEGIFGKTFTLFYGETLRYYFVIEEGGQTETTQERVITMDKVEGIPSSKYQLINQILSARRLDKEQEVISQMRDFLRQEQFVREMFAIETEEESAGTGGRG